MAAIRNVCKKHVRISSETREELFRKTIGRRFSKKAQDASRASNNTTIVVYERRNENGKLLGYTVRFNSPRNITLEDGCTLTAYRAFRGGFSINTALLSR